MNYYDFLAKKQVQNVRSGFEAAADSPYCRGGGDTEQGACHERFFER